MSKLLILAGAFSAVMATSSSKQLIPLLPNELTEIEIIPKIIENESESVKNARLDLYRLSLVSKKFNGVINKKLENDAFTDFFVNTLANKSLLEGNTYAIGAYLATPRSMHLLKFKMLIDDNAKDKIKTAISIIDNAPNNQYSHDPYSLLCHLQHILENTTMSFNRKGEYFYLISNGISDGITPKKVLQLIQEFQPVDLNNSTLLISCVKAYRPDLLPSLYYNKTLNHQDSEGNTALMHATTMALNAAIAHPYDQDKHKKSIESLEFILGKKPDFNIKNKQGLSVLDIVSAFQRNNKKRMYDIKKLNTYHYVQNIVNTTLKSKNDNH